MSVAHSTISTPENAACLYRNSDDKQENSISRQREGVIPYGARKGYKIVSEYVFDGVPGDEIEQHPDWKRLLRDAKGGKWTVLVVDEPSRLSREDPDDFIADVVRPLKRAGVLVDSVSRGVQDWKSLAGIIMAAIYAHKSSEEVKDLSRRVLGGMARLAQQAKFFGWICPYGLRIVRTIDPETGKVMDRKCVFGPEEEVRVVRFIFDAKANRGWSLRRICRELEARGVKPPRGNGRGANKAEGRWNDGTVRKMLLNRKYIGDLPWNETHQGKYSSWKGGKGGRVEQNGRLNRSSSQNSPEDWIIVPDVIPALVDRGTFIRAGVAMAQDQKRTNPKGENDRYLFTHMLVCGDCGGFLRGCPVRGGKGYICGKYKVYGNRACYRNRIMEETLFRAVVEKVLHVVLDPARLDEIEAEIVRRLDAKKSSGGEGKIREHIQSLNRDIAQGNANLARLPEDRLPGVVACLREWEKERDALKVRLQELETGVGKNKAILAEARNQLWRLRDGLEGEDEEKQTAVIRELVTKIEVKFRHEQTHGDRSPTGEKRLLSEPEKAIIYVRNGLGLVSLDAFELSKSGSRRCTKACQ